MNLSLFISRKYLFSSKNKTIINLISAISTLIVAVVTISLLIVLSGFNGLDKLVKNLYTTFDADLTIKPVTGKTFVPSIQLLSILNENSGQLDYTEVIEDNVLIKYKDKQMVVTMKGVESGFLESHSLDTAIVIGDKYLEKDSLRFAILGLGIHNILGIPNKNQLFPVQFIYPKNVKYTGIPSTKLLNIKNINYGGTFALEKQYDEQYAFVPLEFARDITKFDNKITALEINLRDPGQIKSFKKELQARLGNNLEVLESEDIHKSLFKAHNTEKLFVNMIFALILLIASLNIFFTLSMLILEKRKDIAVLKTLGFSSQDIKMIFLKNGFLIAGIGTVIGLILGYGVIIAQIQYGFISMGMESGLVEAYPLEIRFGDFVFVLLIVFLSTLGVSYWPAQRASKIEINQYL